MRTLLAVLAGLVIGTLGTFAYEHYLGEGQRLSQVQTELATANTSLTKTGQDSQALKSENSALSSQVQQLTSTNGELQHQLNDLKKASAPASASNPITDIIKAETKSQSQEKLQLLVSRLHLTPQQEAAVKAAIDEESKAMEKGMSQILQGGKMDPSSMDNKWTPLDEALKGILTPDQMKTYQQVQGEEKSSAAESLATFEMNQMAPSLQLTDAQKDQVYSALYQVQMENQDLAKRQVQVQQLNYSSGDQNTNASASSPPAPPSPPDPTAYLDRIAKTKEDALAKILTPAQMAIYHQQAQNQLQMQKAMIQKMMPTPAPTSTPAPTP